MAFSRRKNTLMTVIVRRKRYLVDQLPRLKFYFWWQDKYLWWLLVVEKNTLMTVLVRRKLYLVIQLPRIKLNLQWQLLSTYDGVLLLKISVSDGLVGNIVLLTRLLPTDVDGFLPSIIRICDGFLCFCDKLWPSQISLFFVVSLTRNPIKIASQNSDLFSQLSQISHLNRGKILNANFFMDYFVLLYSNICRSDSLGLC